MMGLTHKKIGSFFLALILSGLSIVNAKEKKTTHYTTYVNEIIKIFAKEIKKEFDLECVGSGGSMPYDVQEIDVMLATNEKVDCTKARYLGVASVKKLIHIINQHEKIRPYLHQYPFTDKNVWVTISFYNRNGYYLDGSIATVSFLEGDVFYRTAEIKTVYYPPCIVGTTGEIFTPACEEEVEKLIPFMKESYEEALQIVEKEKSLE